ncbi:MAG TPA: hypothetical protein DF613_12790 [Lachnospiraceae bacterium]|nr:hypothetical protein [Lachnospiraceae bacterium]
MGKMEEFLKFLEKRNVTLRDKALRGLCLFLCLMLGFTVLSRAADGVTIARVQVEQASPRTLDKSIEVQGKVTAEREVALRVQAGIVVDSIPVLQGQQVEKGDLLMELNVQDLDEQIRMARMDIEKLELGQKDTDSQRAAANEQQRKAARRAGEDYAKAKKQGSQTVAEAEKELKQAKQKLADFRKNKKKASAAAENGADSVRDSLEESIGEKEAALADAEEEQVRLTAEREDAVKDALASARQENPELTAQEEEALRSGVEQSYGEALDGAKEAVKQAGKDLEEARDALADYDAQQQEDSQAGLEEQEETLAADVEQKEKALKDARNSGQDSKEAARRALEDAQAPQESDSSGAITELEIEQKQAELKKLEVLRKQEGRICAPVNGVVTEICAVVGDRTGDTAAFRLADLQQGCRFTAAITGEQSRYLAQGDPVTLTADGSGKALGEYTVDSVTAAAESEEEEAGEQYEVTVRLGTDGPALGSSATMACVKKTQKYQTTVPLTALHQDNQRNFVWVVNETASVLGSTLTVQRVDVTVAEKNDSYAALSDGSLTSEQQIVIYADRTIESGSRVRLEEE